MYVCMNIQTYDLIIMFRFWLLLFSFHKIFLYRNNSNKKKTFIIGFKSYKIIVQLNFYLRNQFERSSILLQEDILFDLTWILVSGIISFKSLRAIITTCR